MKLEKITYEQFAGVQDGSFSFDHGLNIVVGANESGKSTLAELIYHILFTDCNQKRNSDFQKKYYPHNASGKDGTVIDGTLTFSTEDGSYRLKKEWEPGGGSSRLTLPDGTRVSNTGLISDYLKEVLGYGAGVYGEIVFPSQKRQQMAVQSILSAITRKADPLAVCRDDLASTLTVAALETGGVSLDKVEKALTQKLTELASHWDMTRDLPEGGVKRGLNNPWKRDVGRILEAYYQMEQVRVQQAAAAEAEDLVTGKQQAVLDAKTSKAIADQRKESFLKSRSVLACRKSFEMSIKNTDDALKKETPALNDWPRAIEESKEAEMLSLRKRQAAIRDQYRKALAPYQALQETQHAIAALRPVDSSDLENARAVERKLDRAQSKLAGMNLAVRVRQLGEEPVLLRTVSAGEAVNEDHGEYRISEAVEISIPGITEIQLLPQGIDVEDIKNEIHDANEQLSAILRKYDVADTEALSNLADQYARAANAVSNAESRLQITLRGMSWEQLTIDYEQIPETNETEADVDQCIQSLCDRESVEQFIGRRRGDADRYEKEYFSIDALIALIQEQQQQLQKLRESVDGLGEIPSEFLGIEDLEGYEQQLQLECEQHSRNVEHAQDALTDAYRNLGDRISESYTDELYEKTAAFRAAITEYQHWQHISEVFAKMSGEVVGNPAEDIEKTFSEYLALLSDGGIQLTGLDKQFSASLTSGRHILTFDTLSEGTRDTISLAFRLAMLEHLFPDGNGLAVFDDPFADMDPKRTAQACRLLQRFAENNQVIFITCDEKYTGMLQGKVIEV